MVIHLRRLYYPLETEVLAEMASTWTDEDRILCYLCVFVLSIVLISKRPYFNG